MNVITNDGPVNPGENAAVTPEGKLPIYLNERTARYVRECCEIADIDPDEWVEGWIASMVDQGLNGRYDVTFQGITLDLVEEQVPAGQEGKRTPEEEIELYEKMRGVAFRYQCEVANERQAKGGAK